MVLSNTSAAMPRKVAFHDAKCDQEYVEELGKGFIPLIASNISGSEGCPRDVATLKSERVREIAEMSYLLCPFGT